MSISSPGYGQARASRGILRPGRESRTPHLARLKGDGPMAVTHPGQLAVPAAEPGFTAGMRTWLRTAGERLARRNRRSAARVASAPIGLAERALTLGHDLTGSLVVATLAAVYFQDQGGPGRTWSRLGWEDVDAVRWHDR